jgi:hypothetical protein
MKKRFLFAIVALVGMLGIFTACSKEKELEGEVLCNVTVSGVVSNDKGVAVSGVRVKLYRETASGSWSLVSSSSTNASGAYSISKASIPVILGSVKVAIDDDARYNKSEYAFSIASPDYKGGDRQLFAGTANIEGVDIMVIEVSNE